MKAWIDQFLCIGCGLCTVTCPPTFVFGPDSLAYVRDELGPRINPGRREGVVTVATHEEARVQKSADECPAECIFLTP